MKRQRTARPRYYPGQDEYEEDYAVPIKRIRPSKPTQSTTHVFQNQRDTRRRASRGYPSPSSSCSSDSDSDDVSMAIIRKEMAPLPPLISPPRAKPISPSQAKLGLLKQSLMTDLPTVQQCVKKWQAQLKNFMPGSLKTSWNKPGPIRAKTEALLNAVIASEHHSKCFLTNLVAVAPPPLIPALSLWQKATTPLSLNTVTSQHILTSTPHTTDIIDTASVTLSPQTPLPTVAAVAVAATTKPKKAPGTFGEINPELVRAIFQTKRKPSQPPQPPQQPSSQPSRFQPSQQPSQPSPVKITAVSPDARLQQQHLQNKAAQSLDEALSEALGPIRARRRAALVDMSKAWFKAEARRSDSCTVPATAVLDLLKKLDAYNSTTKSEVKRELMALEGADFDAITMTQLLEVATAVLQPHASLQGDGLRPARSVEVAVPVDDADPDFDAMDDPDYEPMLFDSSDPELERIRDEEARAPWAYLYSEDEGKDDEDAVDLDADFSKEKDDELYEERLRVVRSLRRLETALEKGLLELSSVKRIERPNRLAKALAGPRIKAQAEASSRSGELESFIDPDKLGCLFTALRGKPSRTSQTPSSSSHSQTFQLISSKLPSEADEDGLKLWALTALEATRTVVQRASTIASALRTNGGAADLKASDFVAALIGSSPSDLPASSLQVFLRPNPTERKNMSHIFSHMPSSKELRLLWFNEASPELKSYMVQAALRREILLALHPKRAEPAPPAPSISPSALVQTYVSEDLVRVNHIKTDVAGAQVYAVNTHPFAPCTNDQVRQLCDALQYTCAYFVRSAETHLQHANLLWAMDGAEGPLTARHFARASEARARACR
ncbi:protein ORF145 [Cyprinid herpesvirus 3]|nr:protein ORF145 [Cyprinid herpesvirus 3]AOO32862.1 protein ORF145 [Cyprinid herpesvirus 3]AOO33018.1 protein ORF145 [Cyprinid herpesvirus 3]AOO33174.1 protein ORF145 [Cyprinid herpesvirus 3]AOO33488.1 protein ORF145 [Cyprinid herpesvirus 3]